MPTIVLAATLTSVRSSKTIISASASARIRREAMRANVLKDIGLVTTVERVKTSTSVRQVKYAGMRKKCARIRAEVSDVIG